jgi:periplasmic protein TonB
VTAFASARPAATAATASRLLLAPYYRRFDLPWGDDPDQAARFRKLWVAFLLAGVLLGIVIWLIVLPEPPPNLKPTVPPRLAKIIVEREIPPPPPPPPPQEIEQPKPEREIERPRERPPETDLVRTQKARQKAQNAGLLAMQDQLADIRQQFQLTKDQLTPSANTTGETEGPSRAERSIITSKVGQATGGISMSGQSRGFGSGAGNLGGAGTTQMVVPFGGSGRGSSVTGGSNPNAKGGSGNDARRRSREEIEQVFDRNKGALYALYTRANRENAALQGKLVLEFTILPSGEVTGVRVVSSELNDAELEAKIVARVKLFRFESKDVEPMKATKPIDFFPA